MKLAQMRPIRVYPNEEFKEITLEHQLQFRYAISNKGRLISFIDDMKFGRELKGAKADGYRIFKYRLQKNGKIQHINVLLYKVVAELFVPKTSEDQIHVIHLDRKRDNDDYRNLRWVTKEEKQEFVKKSPFVIQSLKKLREHNIKSDGKKLTETKVMYIKKLLAKPEQRTRLKMIAKQFGVSEVQIRKIKSGENWGHVKV